MTLKYLHNIHRLNHYIQSASIILCLFATHSITYADTSTDSLIAGRIIGVTDGDTVTLLDETNNQHKIRLSAIDAPEKAQPFGNRSKQQLSDICFSQKASVEVKDKDRYGRLIGIVICDDVNANEAMLSAGMAWVYQKYAKGFSDYYALERNARAEKIGLWIDANPIPPWEWRKAKSTQ